MTDRNPFQTPQAPVEGTRALRKIDRSHMLSQAERIEMTANDVTLTRWFAIAFLLQFVAWLVMLVSPAFRRSYFEFYSPVSSLLYGGEGFSRGQYWYFLVGLPLVGSLVYALLTGFIGCGIRHLRERWITRR